MMIPRGGDEFDGGPLDIICILRLPAGTYHAAFFEESPLPGPIEATAKTVMVRLKSKMHHTAGAVTLEGAQEHLDKLRRQIRLPDANVMRDRAIEVIDPVGVWWLRNWHNSSLATELRHAGVLVE